LHWACFYGHERIVRPLLNSKADPRVQDDEGVAPLHLACLSGNLDIAQLLVENGAEISPMDRFLRTPLHYAARASSASVVKFLLENKANPDMVDDAGETPSSLLDGPNAGDLQEIMQRYSDETKRRLRGRRNTKAGESSMFAGVSRS
jgi:ankyrin repeat protein